MQMRRKIASRSSSRDSKPDREELNSRLLQAEERFRLFMENVKEYAIFMLDPSGHVVDWNAGSEHVLGYGPEILGKPFDIFFPPDDRTAGVPERELKRAADTGQASDDRWHVRKNGSYFWALGVTTAMRDEQGRLKGFTKVLRDSTERKHFEEQLRAKNEALENADRLKDEFLAMLAHELRNPLAPIFNALSLLESEQANSDTGRQAREIITRQVRSLARLVDDLLDVSRVSTGKIQLKKEVIDLRDVVRNAVETCKATLQGRQQQLTVSLDPQPVCVDADKIRLEQIITNLLNNASKYSDDNDDIKVSVAQENGRAVLRVKDHGIGISADFLPHVFDLFAQGDRTITRAQGGLGVGLTMVKKLTELHGGTVSVTSNGIGEGSEFVVVLALERESPKKPRLDERFRAPGQTSRPLRIVVVDDNADAAESLAMVLSLSGHDVRTAINAIEATQIAYDHKPDVIFVDIRMPGMSGYQLADHLRRTEDFKDTVLIATTGYSQEDAKVEGVEAGFARFLVKPVDPHTVEQLLASLGADHLSSR